MVDRPEVVNSATPEPFRPHADRNPAEEIVHRRALREITDSIEYPDGFSRCGQPGRAPVWTAAQRIGFRLLFCYLVVYLFPFPAGTLPGTSFLADAYSRM